MEGLVIVLALIAVLIFVFGIGVVLGAALAMLTRNQSKGGE